MLYSPNFSSEDTEVYEEALITWQGDVNDIIMVAFQVIDYEYCFTMYEKAFSLALLTDKTSLLCNLILPHFIRVCNVKVRCKMLLKITAGFDEAKAVLLVTLLHRTTTIN